MYKNGILAGETLPDQLSLLITDNLQAGFSYLITVSATNDVGEGSASPSLEIMAARVPFAPLNV